MIMSDLIHLVTNYKHKQSFYFCQKTFNIYCQKRRDGFWNDGEPFVVAAIKKQSFNGSMVENSLNKLFLSKTAMGRYYFWSCRSFVSHCKVGGCNCYGTMVKNIIDLYKIDAIVKTKTFYKTEHVTVYNRTDSRETRYELVMDDQNTAKFCFYFGHCYNDRSIKG